MAKVYRAIVTVESKGLSVAHVEMLLNECLRSRCTLGHYGYVGITGYNVEILKSEICVWGHGNCSLTVNGPCSKGGNCNKCLVPEHDTCPLVDECECCDNTREGMKNE